MEIDPIIIWNALLSLVYAPLIYAIRSNSNEIQRVNILLNKTREEIPINYVAKSDNEKDMDRLLSRFDKLEEKIESREAEQILESDVFKKSFTLLKDTYLKSMEQTSMDEVKEREVLFQALKVLPEVERHLRIIIEKGKISQQQINKLKVFKY